MVAVSVNNLSKEYKNKSLNTVINILFSRNNDKGNSTFSLTNISFKVEEGSILGIIGSNGAGKSTLFKLLLNSLHKDTGSVNIFGIENTADDFIKIKENIGIIYDSLDIPKYLSPTKIDNVLTDIYKTWNSDKYFELLTALEIPKKKAYRTLSRGNKMKLGFAIAFAHDTKLLLLDEATSGIDPILRNKILELLIDFKNNGGSVIISSHVLSELEKICDDILILNDGKILLKDSLENIQKGFYTENELEDLYIKLIMGDVS